jgi:hypothetical protein
MTKSELREIIKEEARIPASTTLDSLIDSIVLDVLDDYCLKSRYQELLVLDSTIVPVSGQAAYSLPVDYQNIDKLRYAPNGSTIYWEVKAPNPNFRRRNNVGYPNWYVLAADQITLYPSRLILTTDSIKLDYYKSPIGLFQLSTDPFPVPRIESAVRADALARISRFHQDPQSEASFNQGGAKSFIAAESK